MTPSTGKNSGTIRPDDQDIADAALMHLLTDSDLVGAFLAASGMSVQDLRRAAAQPGLATQALEFICEDDQRVMDLAAASGRLPEQIAHARVRLAGPGSYGWDAD